MGDVLLLMLCLSFVADIKLVRLDHTYSRWGRNYLAFLSLTGYLVFHALRRVRHLKFFFFQLVLIS